MKGFGGKEPTKIPPRDEVLSHGGDGSQSEFEVARKPPKRPFGSRSCSEA
jgi:hypothetical protein